MGGHHLILGRTTDFLSGQKIEDTHDERYRQAIAKRLVRRLGYRKQEIMARYPLRVDTGSQRAIVPIDFLIQIDARTLLLVKYGPGSIVTRHRPTLAAARLVCDYQVPRVVVTNGEQSDLLDGASGKVIAQGLDHLPDRPALTRLSETWTLEKISAQRARIEARILYAYEVDGCCPCDDTICRLP